MEIGALSNKTSATVASWFHREVVCRFGPPYAVRVDKGKEFEGAFAEYLRDMGIWAQVVFAAHPRANG